MRAFKHVHHITGNWIVHKSMIKKISKLFYETVELFKNESIKATFKGDRYFGLSDQCILTYIYMKYPELFNCVADGYAAIIPALWYENYKTSRTPEELQEEIDGLKDSLSWKITKPLREFKYFLNDIRR